MRTTVGEGEGAVPPELRALEKDYVFIRELGRGGTATVLLARHRARGQLVAVKMIYGPHLADEEANRRFAREASLVEHLDHPNIVRTHTVERLDGRALAIVMEHIVGATLRQALRDGPFAFDRTTKVLRDVGEALLYAHAQGLVHRDVKPENIFLEQGTGRALLSDFGTARSVTVDASLTLTGSAIGTPAYMSPEQIDGGALDGRSDLYALGLVGWEMLAGRRAYDDESVYGILYKQKHEPLPSLAELRPDIPARLLFAIEGALRKNRDERWADMEAFLAQLLRDRMSRPADTARHRELTPPRAEPASAPTVRLERPRAVVTPRESKPLAVPLDQWDDEPPGGWDDLDAPDPFRRRIPIGVIALLALAVAAVAAFTNADELRRMVAGISRAQPVQGSGGTLAAAGDTVADSTTSLDTSELAHDTALTSALEAAAKARDTLLDTMPAADSAPQPDTETRSADTRAASTAPPAPARSPAAVERVGPPPRTRMDSLRRCNSPVSADQRACLGAWVAEGDVELNRVYRQLVGQLYRQAGDNTASIRTLATQQRGWLAYRDADCARRYPARAGSLWAPKRAACMGRMGDARVAELTRRTASLSNQ
ncbi:MAG TPA: protein kinase [Gemmatimonadaceae bacterium]|nr:protein kinase [Gemmatimonadaceae bacterium]